jgi:ribosomal protein S18 acetylase RimI-like enzyme
VRQSALGAWRPNGGSKDDHRASQGVRTGVAATIRKAATGEEPALSAALARAFFGDPVFRWALPDDERRSRQLPPFFSLFVETLFRYHEIYTDEDLSSAALWVPPEEKPTPEDAEQEFGERMEEIAGVDIERLFQVSKVIEEHHPPGSYYFLQFMGVDPERQGQGIGSALLRLVLERSDRQQQWAYLDATSERNKQLYERHGFEAEAEYGPEGGPPLWPMWREPRAA